MKNVVLLYEKSEKRGQMATVTEIPFSDKDALRSAINDDELYDKLEEDEEILREILPPLDKGRVLGGAQSPLFFGSAIADFGVDKFLDYFVDYGSIPASRKAVIEGDFEGKSDEQVRRRVRGAACVERSGEKRRRGYGWVRDIHCRFQHP